MSYMNAGYTILAFKMANLKKPLLVMCSVCIILIGYYSGSFHHNLPTQDEASGQAEDSLKSGVRGNQHSPTTDIPSAAETLVGNLPKTGVRISIVKPEHHSSVNVDNATLLQRAIGISNLNYSSRGNGTVTQNVSSSTMTTTPYPNEYRTKGLYSNRPQEVTYNITIENQDGRRTGNLMFNFAVMIATAHRNHLQPVWIYIDRPYGITSIFTTNVTVVKYLNETTGKKNSKVLGERGASRYNSQVENITNYGYGNHNIVLKGWFQSWKYSKDCVDLVRQHFQFKSRILSKSMSFFKTYVSEQAYLLEGNGIAKAIINDTTLIGVHVRRGDIIKSSFAKFGYTAPEINYFEKAVAYFVNRTKNPHFVICTDDFKWANETLRDLHPRISFSRSLDGAVDLAILSMCRHTIMSTGTYGWWAAWLTNGTTIYYSNWPRKGSTLDKKIVREDFFMPHWIGME